MAISRDCREPKCMNVLLVILFHTLIVQTVTGQEELKDYTPSYYCSFCACRPSKINGIVTNCSRLGLFRPPRSIDIKTSELYLSNNLIKSVKYSNFAGLYNLEILDLSGNIIIDIEVGAFKDLSNLTHLYLNGQISARRLVVLHRLFKPGVFDGLDNLKVLYIHNLLRPSEVSYSFIPVLALHVLVSLEELYIDGVNNAKFNESFHSLKNLSTVVMSGFDGTCIIEQLDRHSFVGLENVRNLTLSKCRITKLGVGIFWRTPRLKYLDLSWNIELEIKQFGTVLEELKYTDLQILKINAIHNPNRAGTEILRSDIKYLRDINLVELFIDENGIEFVDYGVFNMFPKTLKKLYLRRNKLDFGYFLYELVFNNRNLQVLDAGDQAVAERSDRVFTQSFQKLYRHLLSKRHIHQGHTSSDSPPVLNLKTLVYSATLSDLKPLNFSATINNITYMDLSRNFMPTLEPFVFDGLYHLKHINLSHNYIEHVHTLTFHGLSSVQLIDLENNILGPVLKSDKNGKLFASLVQSRIFLLSRNRITSLDKNIFTYTKKLETIDLSFNYIEKFDIEVSTLVNLKYIDLSYNRLHFVAPSIRSHFSSVRGIKLVLRNNNLLCNCDNIPFLKWLFHSDVEFVGIKSYYCSVDGGSVRYFNESRVELLSNLEEECKSYVEIIVGSSTVGSFIISIVISYVVYRHRWKLRYMFYMARIKFDNKNKDGEADKKFIFDVFISYGDGDRGFVTVDMLQNLEVDGGKRLNIRDRDFEIGEVIAVNISKAIRTSKKTFLLLSRHFLHNKWCNFEMNMARMEAVHMKREVIVLIFMEEIPAKVLPIEIIDLLRECPNMDLPKDKGVRAAFWQKCLDYINSD